MNKSIVGIIMGSDSDLPIMSDAAKILDELKIPYELTIVSAHRTPKRMTEYGETAEKKRNKSHYCWRRRICTFTRNDCISYPTSSNRRPH